MKEQAQATKWIKREGRVAKENPKERPDVRGLLVGSAFNAVLVYGVLRFAFALDIVTAALGAAAVFAFVTQLWGVFRERDE